MHTLARRIGPGLAVAAAVMLTTWLGSSPAHAVILGQTDDFQDGTVQNWNGAPGFFNNVAGGQVARGDLFLDITTSGFSGGQGSRPATYNDSQWAGDYLAAGVNTIQMDMANFGSTDLSMRALILFSPGGDFTSTNALVVPADGVWRTYQFDLADMTNVGGGGTGVLNDTLAAVGRMLCHQPGAPTGVGGAPAVTDGHLGLDNITALAVPAPSGLLLLGTAALVGRRRRRRG